MPRERKGGEREGLKEPKAGLSRESGHTETDGESPLSLRTFMSQVSE